MTLDFCSLVDSFICSDQVASNYPILGDFYDKNRGFRDNLYSVCVAAGEQLEKRKGRYKKVPKDLQ